MAVYFDPRVGGGAGNLASAVGLYDQYFGTGSKLREQQLQLGGQELKAHQIANEGSGMDLANRKATDAVQKSFSTPELGMNFYDLPSARQQQARDTFYGSGGTDFSLYPKIHQSAVTMISGNLPTPKNSFPVGGQSDSSGQMSGQFVTLPPEVQPPSGASEPSAATQPASAPAPTTPPPVPSGTSQVPNLTGTQIYSPVLRQVHQYQVETAAKEQELAKAAREAALGTPEEQNRARDFSNSASDLSKNLEGLKSQVVSGTGGNAPWHAAGFGKVSILPRQIAENWKHVNNPGGASLKPGQGDEAAGELIPLPSMKWYNLGGKLSPITNEKTSQAIGLNEDLLATKIKAYENDPATRLPVLGLDPAIRSKVGLPPQRLIDNLRMQGKDPSEIQAGAQSGIRTIQPGEEHTVKPGETVIWGPTGQKIQR